MTSPTIWRRAALKSSASVSGSVGAAAAPVRASRTSRTRSPSHVPPGSRVRSTRHPARGQVVPQALGLGRLAAAVGSVDRDERAVTGRRRVGDIGASVADPSPGPPSSGSAAGRVPSAPWDATSDHAVHPRARRLRRSAAVAAAVGAAVGAPGLVAAHPLGNFTINHYAEVRVEPERVLLDVVIDQAEIAAFQARQGFDTDADGSVSDEEIEAGRIAACDELAADLRLDGRRRRARPPNDRGRALLPARRRRPVDDAARVRLRGGAAGSDRRRTDADRVQRRRRTRTDSAGARSSSGDPASRWRSSKGELRDESVSARLTAYPEELVALPLADAQRRRRRHGRWRGARRRSTSRTRTRSMARPRPPSPSSPAAPVASTRRSPSPTPGRLADAGRRRRPRRHRWRRAARHLRRGRPHAGHAAAVAAHGRGPGRRSRPDAGPRQDADGRLPRRDAGTPLHASAWACR